MNGKRNHKQFFLLFFVLCLLFFIVGCSQPLRFAPSKSIKQSAELTYLIAQKINEEGTQPQSPASEKMLQGTLVSLSYTGRPNEPPDPQRFETITEQAQQDAIQRPDAWQMADAALELGIGISALLGGVYGTRAVKYLQQTKTKSIALREIIKGNELFKDQADQQTKEAFAKAQNITQETNGTKQIVAQVKLT